MTGSSRAKVRQRRTAPSTPRKKAAKSKRKYPEFQIQVSLASLLRQYYPEILWFAIPNGGKRSIQDAKRFKAMGVRKGVYDIFVSEPTPVYPGYYLEMKAPGGRLSDDQKEFRAQAEARGYLCEESDSALDGLRQIEEYVGIPKAERFSQRALFPNAALPPGSEEAN